MVKVIFTRNARNDLKEIYTFQKTGNRNSAFNLVNQLHQKSTEILTNSPLAGHLETLLENLEMNLRSLIIQKRYKIIYYIENNTVYVTAVWDCRQNPNQLTQKLSQ